MLIRSIQAEFPLPFRDYMACCLYEPQFGYYSRPTVPTASKEGDFMTSVSVGPVFGHILAARLCRFWSENGQPSEFSILEPGGHDGALARDILKGAQTINPDFHRAIRYFVHEPHPDRRSHLSKILGDLAEVIASPREVHAPLGAVVANEVLDALPLPIYLFSGGRWHEAAVTVENQRLEWAAIDTHFSLPGDYPEGYVTEGSPDFENFLSPLSEAFEQSLMVLIDYGLDEESLYHPDRSVGTLRCYRNHRTNVHPLEEAGRRDLTADVNFTAVSRAAARLGLESHPVMNQSRYLTYCAREWLLQGPTAKEVRQFQTLIHPSQFGSRFHVAEFTNGGVSRAFPA